ncbi:ATPase [Pseudoalteromonas luteoviolacea]|uniref:ATPase n=1 Tax=Pseudoalteromonas luteoviolacea TaxID=43657 RepID=A0A1C0TS25_9GAMM|nr:cell division protein ZapE [Pseudoalteromonas luteoviolacea]OCQ22049.1 ATPase [Pseudoalteromonas luteoviolacea]
MYTIQTKYEQLVSEGSLTSDNAQSEAILKLDQLLLQLEQSQVSKGIYLYGPVGRGKSFLMDLFFKAVKSKKKKRLHFHHFMAQIHQQLKEIQGTKNPLQKIAKIWAKTTKVLCFDEFFVKDIGDAMILAGLLDAFIKSGIIFVTTSNSHPTELYKNGLQRSRFEPTIDLLLKHCHVVGLSGEIDHRFRHGFQSHFYFNDNQEMFDSLFTQASGSRHHSNIELLGRTVPINGSSPSALLFEFMSLCSSPRATADYIELANRYDVIFVQSVPKMGCTPTQSQLTQGVEDGYIRQTSMIQTSRLDDEARRFIALIDEFYDRKKLVVISANCPLETLYVGEQLSFEFERTKSRLVEMQSWHLTI